MNDPKLACEPLEHRRLLSSTVSIGTVVDTAYRQTAQEGLIVVSRKGDLSEPLVVPLLVGGTAQNVTEYGRIGPRLTILAGERSVAIPVRPVYPGPAGDSNYVSVSLGQMAGLRFGNQTATVGILDNPDSTPPQFVTTRPGTPARFFVSTEQRRDGSAFVIQRSGDVSAREIVNLDVRGTAQNGVDFGRIGERVVFETGQSTIILPVRTPTPTFAGSRTVSVALPGALPVSQSSIVLNGIDLSGNLDTARPIAGVPDPVFPDTNTGIGLDTNGNDVRDGGLGFDPTDNDPLLGVGTGGNSDDVIELPGAVPAR